MSNTEFQQELKKLINIQSMENGSNTPDWILAQYLTNCLKTFDSAVEARTRWYSEDLNQESTS